MLERQSVTESKLIRPKPFPDLQFYVNEHFFPGLIDQPVLRETMLRAIRKINGKRLRIEDMQVALNEAPGDIIVGSREAPLRIVRYDTPEFDAATRFFASTFPNLKTEFIDTGKVQFVLRPYTWFQNGHEAAAATLCVPGESIEKLRFFALASLQSKEWLSPSGFWNYREDGLNRLLKIADEELNLTRVSTRACSTRPDISLALDRIRETANSKFGYFYSPTLFIGTTEHTINYNWPALRAIINRELARIEE